MASAGMQVYACIVEMYGITLRFWGYLAPSHSFNGSKNARQSDSTTDRSLQRDLEKIRFTFST